MKLSGHISKRFKLTLQTGLLLLGLFLVGSTSGQVVGGKLDLRGYNLDDPIALNGYWEFYWNELVSPNQLRPTRSYYYFPSLWEGEIPTGETIEAIGYATYHMKVIVDQSDEEYALFLDDNYSSYRLYVNGEILATNGIVSNTKSSYSPEWRPQVISLPENQNEYDLVLQIANFHHSKGGAGEPILFGEKNDITRFYERIEKFDIFLTLSFLICSLFFLLRFGFISLDMGSLYFSLFCLLYSYRIVGTETYVLHSYLTDYPWTVGIRFEYLSLYLTPFLFGKYLNSIFPDESSKLAVNILGVIGVLFSVSLFFPALVFTKFIGVFFLILGGYMVYAFVIFITAFIRNREGSIYGIISASLVFASFGYQIATYYQWAPQFFLFNYTAMFLFIALQSLQLYKISKTHSVGEMI